MLLGTWCIAEQGGVNTWVNLAHATTIEAIADKVCAFIGDADEPVVLGVDQDRFEIVSGHTQEHRQHTRAVSYGLSDREAEALKAQRREHLEHGWPLDDLPDTPEADAAKTATRLVLHLAGVDPLERA